MFRSAVLAEEASCDIDGATSWDESQSGAALANAFLDCRCECVRCVLVGVEHQRAVLLRIRSGEDRDVHRLFTRKHDLGA